MRSCYNAIRKNFKTPNNKAKAIGAWKVLRMYKIIIPVLMGLESVTGDELEALGFSRESITKENGLVILEPGQEREAIAEAAARCNMFLRTAERVEVEVASFKAENFDELFDAVQTLPWEDWIEPRAAFTVKGYSRQSKLFAPSAMQSTIKKAIVLRLLKARHMPEGALIEEDRDFCDLRIQYSVMNDQVSLRFDTSGEGLHKRGYRKAHNAAPIKETLAAGILYLSRWEPFSGELLYDPVCGSGTFLIEGALMAANIAPGVGRDFRGESWKFIGKEAFARAREEALDLEDRTPPDQVFIAGSDVNGRTLALAKENAGRAGVRPFIRWAEMDLFTLNEAKLRKYFGMDKILFVANPPYGERMSDPEEARRINRALAGLALEEKQNYTKENCRLSVMTSADFEADTGRRADKRRKLYNGMIKCTLYHYFREIRRKD